MWKFHKKILSFLAFCVSVSTADECFRTTSLKSCWTRKCRKDQFISSIDTVYDPQSSDRIWQICCRNIQMSPSELATITCTRTGREYHNSVWGSFRFSCSGSNSYLSGIHSCYSDTPIQDRRFKFRCCQTPTVVTRDCENWGVNGLFLGNSSFLVENGRIMKGMNGYFESRHRDRVYENTDCAMIRR